jgi:hypothetical protein
MCVSSRIIVYYSDLDPVFINLIEPNQIRIRNSDPDPDPGQDQD